MIFKARNQLYTNAKSWLANHKFDARLNDMALNIE